MLGTGSNNFYKDIVMHWPEYHRYQLKMAALWLMHISQMGSIMKLLPHTWQALCHFTAVYHSICLHSLPVTLRLGSSGQRVPRWFLHSQSMPVFLFQNAAPATDQQKSSQSDSVWTLGLINGQLKKNFISSTKPQQVLDSEVLDWGMASVWRVGSKLQCWSNIECASLLLEILSQILLA